MTKTLDLSLTYSHGSIVNEL